MQFLSLEKISFSYAARQILSQVSFAVSKGEIVSLLGPSGCGKTTLLRLITGLIPLQEGKILLDDTVVQGTSPLVTYMMQDDLLLSWRTVLENVLLPIELAYPRRQRNPYYFLAELLLEEVGLIQAKDQYPDQLSGGMRQRVALARALLQGRPLILLDEPFGALDSFTREQMYNMLLDIRAKHQKTLLFVTHDLNDALILSDRILLMAPGRGIVDEVAVPSDLQPYGKLFFEMQHAIREKFSGWFKREETAV